MLFPAALYVEFESSMELFDVYIVLLSLMSGFCCKSCLYNTFKDIFAVVRNAICLDKESGG